MNLQAIYRHRFLFALVGKVDGDVGQLKFFRFQGGTVISRLRGLSFGNGVDGGQIPIAHACAQEPAHHIALIFEGGLPEFFDTRVELMGREVGRHHQFQQIPQFLLADESLEKQVLIFFLQDRDQAIDKLLGGLRFGAAGINCRKCTQ